MVISDINLPGANGLELGKEIINSFPRIKLVFLSMYNEPGFLKTAKEIGAHGYLLKDSKGTEILNTVQSIFNGHIIYDAKIIQNIPNLHHDDYFIKTFSLSKREIEIISFIRQGFTTEQIANQLFISYETVKSHRKNIFLKLGINKVNELIQFAVEQRL